VRNKRSAYNPSMPQLPMICNVEEIHPGDLQFEIGQIRRRLDALAEARVDLFWSGDDAAVYKELCEAERHLLNLLSSE